MLININKPFLNAAIWHQDLIGQLRLQSQTLLRGTRPKAAKMLKIHVKQSNGESIKKREEERYFMKILIEGGSLLNDALCNLIAT